MAAMAHDDASLKRTFERLLWQRSEVLKLIDKTDPANWRKDNSEPVDGMIMCHGSLYENVFELVKGEWEDLERMDGREPVIVNDEQFGGDPGAEMPDHAISLAGLRTRNGCLGLWQQNEARKAAMLMDFENIDLEREITWEIWIPSLPGIILEEGLEFEDAGEYSPERDPDAPQTKEIRATVRQLIWNWAQPLTISIAGVRHALEVQGFKEDIARIYPPESMKPA